MKNRFRTKVGVASAAGLSTICLIIGSANAALTLTLSEPGFAPVTFTDATNTGVISNFAPYGTYNLVDVNVASSNKLQSPTPAEAILQITSIVESNVSNTQTPLTILVQDNGYTFPGTSGTNIYLDSSLGGTLAPATAGDKVTFQSYGNGNFDASPITGATGGMQSYVFPGGSGNNAFTVPDANTTFTLGSAYNLTNETVITLNNAYETVNVSGTTSTEVAPVPEPSTAAVSMGIMGSLVLLQGRRRPAMR